MPDSRLFIDHRSGQFGSSDRKRGHLFCATFRWAWGTGQNGYPICSDPHPPFPLGLWQTIENTWRFDVVKVDNIFGTWTVTWTGGLEAVGLSVGSRVPGSGPGPAQSIGDHPTQAKGGLAWAACARRAMGFQRTIKNWRAPGSPAMTKGIVCKAGNPLKLG